MFISLDIIYDRGKFMNIAKFEKVSYQQYAHDQSNINQQLVDEQDYENITLPKRATKASAGYDFFVNQTLIIKPHETITYVTGLRCKIDDNWVLMIFPRSGLGFKYRFQLDNTVGIIDADYYHADNQGHIMIKMTNNSDKEFTLNKGDGLAQGIFLPYGLADVQEVTAVRTGGLGSTTK